MIVRYALRVSILVKPKDNDYIRDYFHPAVELGNIG